MELTEGNTQIVESKKIVDNTGIVPRFTVRIYMPDGSRNYVHSKDMDLESAIITRELIIDQSIDHVNIVVRRDGDYYRLVVVLKLNDDTEEFHSRKLNLNDVVFERNQLIISDV